MSLEAPHTDPNMNSDENDEQYTSEHLFPLYEIETQPNYVRPFVAGLMIIVFITTAIYFALRPWLDPSFSQTIAFDATLTGVAATNSDCRRTPPVNITGSIMPTRNLCICGVLYTDEEIDYELRLQDATGQAVTTLLLNDQSVGPFCHLIQLPTQLAIGRYVIRMMAPRNAQPVAVFWFSVQS